MNQENNNNNATTSDFHPNDVLLGRGGVTNNHRGNKRFRQIVALAQPRYLYARKKDKRSFAEAVVDNVQASGGKFLQLKDGTWVEVERKRALAKASQCLRENLDVGHKSFRTKAKASPKSPMTPPLQAELKNSPTTVSITDEQQQSSLPRTWLEQHLAVNLNNTESVVQPPAVLSFVRRNSGA